MNKVVFVVNRATDISLAQILFHTKPSSVNMQIVATVFSSSGDFSWKKSKNLQVWLQNEDLENMRSFFKDNLIICQDYKSLKGVFDNNSIGLFPGREPFVFKNLCKKIVCISGVRDYFSRYLDLIQLGSSHVKVCLNSSTWLNEGDCRSFGMGTSENYTQDYNFINKNIEKFFFADPYCDFKKILDKIGKEKIKKSHDIPLDKKVALVSLRRGDHNLTFHKSDKDFFNSTIEKLKELRDKGFFIIARRRLSVDDVKNRRKNSAENVRYDEFKKYIDYDMSGWSGFPSSIWQACFVADLMLLADMSGIARREGTVCLTPILLPEYDIDTYNKNMKTWDPGMVALHESNLMSKEIDLLFRKDYKNRMIEYNKKWHSAGCQNFWKEIIEGFNNA